MKSLELFTGAGGAGAWHAPSEHSGSAPLIERGKGRSVIPQFVNIAAATPRQTKPERVTACITGLYIKIGDILRSCEHNVPYEVLDVRGDEVDMIARCSVDPGLKSGDAIMLSAPKKPVRYILAYPSNDSIMKRQKAGLLHSRVSVK